MHGRTNMAIARFALHQWTSPINVSVVSDSRDDSGDPVRRNLGASILLIEPNSRHESPPSVTVDAVESAEPAVYRGVIAPREEEDRMRREEDRHGEWSENHGDQPIGALARRTGSGIRPDDGVPGRSLAAEPAGKEWIGQRVVPKQRDFALRDDEGSPARAAKIAIYRVDQVKGGSLRLTPDGGSTAGPTAGQVVPVEQAVEFFSDAIGESPRDPYNYAMRAMVLLFEREDAEHALADCDAGDPARSQGCPRPRHPRRRPGGQPGLDKAIADFSEVIRLTPQEPDAYRDRGVARMSSQDFDGAIADFNEAIRLDPKDSSTFVSRAAAWLSKKQDDKAMADFDEAIRLDPKNADAYLLRASVRGQKGEFDQAIADFTPDHQARSPGPAGVRGARHGLAAQEGIRSRDRRLQRGHPPRPEERRRLHRPRAHLARSTAGRQGHRRPRPGHQLDPQNPDAYGVRGDAWADKKDFDKAIADYTRLITARPEERLGLLQPRPRPGREAAIRQGDRRSRPGHPARAPEPRCLQRPRLVPGDLPGRDLPRRRPGHRGGDQGLRADRLERARPARHPRRRLCRGRRLRLGREMAGQGDRAGNRRPGEGRVRRAAQALQGQEAVSRDEALIRGPFTF